MRSLNKNHARLVHQPSSGPAALFHLDDNFSSLRAATAAASAPSTFVFKVCQYSFLFSQSSLKSSICSFEPLVCYGYTFFRLLVLDPNLVFILLYFFFSDFINTTSYHHHTCCCRYHFVIFVQVLTRNSSYKEEKILGIFKKTSHERHKLRCA